MLKISIFELFAAAIPEAIVFVTGTFIVANQRLNALKIALIGLLVSVITYFVRLLPLFPGANILFSILISSVLLVVVGKIEVIKAVPAVLMMFIIRLVTEGITIVSLVTIFHMDLDILANDPVKKTVAFVPSLLLYIAIVFVICIVKRKMRKVDTNEPG